MHAYQFYVPVIIAPPSQPIGLTTTSIQPTTVTITWSKPSDTGGRSDIFYTVMIEGDGMSQTLPSTGNITTYTITGLTPSTNYDITVIAENGVSHLESDISTRTAIIMVTTNVPCEYTYYKISHMYINYIMTPLISNTHVKWMLEIATKITEISG